MSSKHEPVRILAPRSFREVLSRRALLQVGAGSVGLTALLAALISVGVETSNSSISVKLIVNTSS